MLESTLKKVRNAAKGSMGLTSVANQITKISNAAKGLTEGGIKKLSNLASALDRIGRLGDIRLSPNIGTQLSKIAVAAGQLETVDLTKLTTLADAMRPFSSLGTAHLTSYINQLGKLPEVIKELNAADLDKFIANIKELNTALAPFGDTMQKIANGFAAFPSRIQRLVQSTEKYNQTMSRANKVSRGGLWAFLNSSYSKYLALAGALGLVSNTLGGYVYKSTSYMENLNLFTVAMGKYAGEAKEYAAAVNEALGIDMSEWMRNQGIFMQIATGFGVIEEKAYTMSQGLTQIAYDIASFYNISTEDAMQKVQSGISGELEPLRRLGYALDAATLQQVAYNHGIEQSINTMTQAQKSQLRYVAIMEQSKNVMGDMARTIMSPANAMRVMNMQLEQLERALGNLILPLLIEILPYVQAFVVVLTDAINKLAVLIGFELPEIDYSGLGGLTSGAEDAEGAIDETTEAVKELQNAMLGIDELNVISPKTETAGLDEGAYDLPIDIESYEFFNEKYKSIVSSISDSIEEFFDRLSPLFDGFVSVFEPILSLFPDFDDGGFFEWLEDVGNWMDENPEALYEIGRQIGTIVTAILAYKAAMKGWAGFTALSSGLGTLSGKLGKVIPGFEKLQGILGEFGKVLKALLPFVTKIASAVAGFVATLLGLFDALDKGLNVGNLTTIIGGAVTMAVALGLAFGGIGVAVGAGVGAIALLTAAIDEFSSEGVTGEAIAAMTGFAAAITAVGVAVGTAFGAPWGIAAAAIGAVASAGVAFTVWMHDDLIPEVEIFDETISTTTREKVEPLTDKIRELSDALHTIEFTRAIITEDDVENVRTRVAEIKSIILNELTIDGQAAASALAPIREALGTELYEVLLKANSDYYADIATQISDGEARINEIMAAALAENRTLTDTEWSEIYRIQADMQDKGVQHLSETDLEYRTIMSNLKDAAVRITFEQANEVIKNAISTRDSAITAAEEQYSGILLEAERMKDFGIINETQYDLIRDAAARTRQEMIDNANDQYGTIVNTVREKLGEAADFINYQTGEIKSRWEWFWDYLPVYTNQKLTEIKAGIANFGTAAATFIADSFDKALKSVERFVNLTIDYVNRLIDLVNGFGLNLEKIEHISLSVGDILSGTMFGQDISATAMEYMRNQGLELVNGVWQGIDSNASILTGEMETITNSMVEAVSHGVSKFPELGENVVMGIVEGLDGNSYLAIDGIGTISNDMLERCKEILGIHSPSTVFYDNAVFILEGLANGIEENSDIVYEEMEELYTAIMERFTEFSDTFTETYAVYQETHTTMNQTMLDALRTANDAYILHLETTFKTYTETHLADLATFSQSVISAHTRYQNTLRSNFNAWTSSYLAAARAFVRELNTIMASVGSGVSSGKTASWTDRVSVRIPAYADGGYPDEGQLFVARERGAEMVGTIGGRTAVANNDQIVEAIREGVYDAVSAARAQDSGGDTYVYLDGEQIATRIEKRRKDNGLSIYSGGVM